MLCGRAGEPLLINWESEMEEVKRMLGAEHVGAEGGFLASSLGGTWNTFWRSL